MIELVAEPWLECTRRGAPQGGLGKIRNRNRNRTSTARTNATALFFLFPWFARLFLARASDASGTESFAVRSHKFMLSVRVGAHELSPKEKKTVDPINGDGNGKMTTGKRVQKFFLDATGCDTPAGAAMFTFDLLLLLVICYVQGFIFARNNQIWQIDRGAKVKCDAAFQNLVRVTNKVWTFRNSEKALYDATAFFTNRESFRLYAQGNHYNGSIIHSWQWVPEVLTAEDRTPLELEGQAFTRDSPLAVKLRDGNLFKDHLYRFHEIVNNQARTISSPLEAPWYPVHYVEPLAGSEPLLGYNLGSEASWLATIKAVKASSQPIASERLLVVDKPPQYGFRVTEPVVDSYTDPLKSTFRGALIGTFRLQEMMNEAMTGYALRNVFVILYDLTGEGTVKQEEYLAHYVQGETDDDGYFAKYVDATVAEARVRSGLSLHWSYQVSVADRVRHMLSWDLPAPSLDP